MTTAKLYISPSGPEVIITHGSGVTTKMWFETEAAARHHFLDQLGWYEEQGVWHDHESILPSFVPVPRFVHGARRVLLKDVPVEWPLYIYTTRCSVAGIRGIFHAFYYQTANLGLLDFDPILSIASPLPLKIGAIGAWPSTFTAGDAAQLFYDQLLETYGHEYFRRAVDANIRRELLLDQARHEVAVDAKDKGQDG